MKLENVSIRHRIAILVVLPLVALLAIAGIEASEKLQQKKTAERLTALIELAPTFSAVVHEMQKERGMSAGFIASGGVNFKDKLPTQRISTDEKTAVLKAELDSVDKSGFSEEITAKIEASLSRMSELSGKRGEVDSRSITVPQMAKYYTGTIRSFLGVIDEMVVISQSAGDGLNAQISAYTLFLQAKERAGVERAMGAAGFGAGQFKPAVHQRFLQLISAQETYLGSIPSLAAPEDVAFMAATLKGPVVEEVDRLRKIAIANPQTLTTEGVSAPQWFGAITEKINLMKAVEDRVAQTVVANVGKLQKSAEDTITFLLIETAVALAIVIAMSIYIIGGITRPIGSLTDEMGQLAEGHLETDISGVHRGDEIGAMAGAVQVFKNNAIEIKRLQEEQAANQAHAEAQRKAELNQLADGFEADVGEVVRSVAAAATELKAASDSMTSTADSMQSQTEHVSAASGTAAANVQTVASAAEELSASIGEIRQLVERSADVAEQASSNTTDANAKVASLSDSARDIGEVVSLINDIAEQTNLLALNATIEAARAGDAGKGFAVVASEVKNLAGQTSKATEDISHQVSAIQGATTDAVSAIQSIAHSIGDVNESMSAIQTSVQQQADATQEIARNVEQAAAGTTEVDHSISSISSAAEETSAASGQIVGAANELSQQSENLASRVGSFVDRVRSENQAA